MQHTSIQERVSILFMKDCLIFLMDLRLVTLFHGRVANTRVISVKLDRVKAISSPCIIIFKITSLHERNMSESIRIDMFSCRYSIINKACFN